MSRMNQMTRMMCLQARALDDANTEMWVEGYAVVFDSPTVLYEIDGMEYREEVCRGAFDGCQSDNVIFNYNHGGMVVARTTNGTLETRIDDKGLFIRARLDGTDDGQKLYRAIQGKYIDRMSFQFSIADETYDRDAKKWSIRKIKRLYDVSAVDIPAYEDTNIQARRNQIEEIERTQNESNEAGIKLLELKTKL